MRAFVVSISMIIGLAVLAQDSTTKIRAINVVALTFNSQTELIAKELLQVQPSMNYAELLQLQSGVFVRSQGIGALNTLSYKGLSTANIPITINGFNVQSSMNGSLDLSLLSSFHFNNSSFDDFKPQSTVAANLGDGLALRSTGKKEPKAFVQYTGVNALSLGAAIAQTKENFVQSLSIAADIAKNDFSLKHYDIDGKLQNGKFNNLSALYTLSTYGNKLSWSATVFAQGADRQISQSLHAIEDAEQFDLNLLIGNKFTYEKGPKLRLYLTQQMNREQIRYSSEFRDLDVNSVAYNASHNISSDIDVAEHFKLNVGLLHQLNNYRSEALQTNVLDHRLRAHLNSTYYLKRSDLRLNIYSNLLREAFGFHFKYHRPINLKHDLSFTVARKYRLPLLNELYWYEPGYALGNKDLKAEQGYRVDATYTYAAKKWSVRTEPYIGWFENMITWVGYPVIQAENIRSVFVRGNEFDLRYTLLDRSHKLKILHQNNLNFSTIQDPLINPDTDGKQMIYTPVFTANLMLIHSYKNYGSYFNVLHVGRNYYTSDNTASLDPYQLLEVGAHYTKGNLQVGLALKNILNTAYFSIPNRPLPGRHIRISLTYKFNKKPKTTK